MPLPTRGQKVVRFDEAAMREDVQEWLSHYERTAYLLSRLSGIDHSVLYKWFSGKSIPLMSLETAGCLAHVCELDVSKYVVSVDGQHD